MSDHGANGVQMQRLDTLPEPDLVRLFSGATPVGGDDLEGVAQFFQTLRTDFASTPSESTEIAHLTAMFEAAHAEAPRRRALTAATAAGGLHRRGRIAAIVLAATTVFAGTAYAGALPGPLQDAVAKVASAIGVPVPAAGHPSSQPVGGAPTDDNTGDSTNADQSRDATADSDAPPAMTTDPAKTGPAAGGQIGGPAVGGTPAAANTDPTGPSVGGSSDANGDDGGQVDDGHSTGDDNDTGVDDNTDESDNSSTDQGTEDGAHQSDSQASDDNSDQSDVGNGDGDQVGAAEQGAQENTSIEQQGVQDNSLQRNNGDAGQQQR